MPSFAQLKTYVAVVAVVVASTSSAPITGQSRH